MRQSHLLCTGIITLLLASMALLGVAYRGELESARNTLAYLSHVKQLTGIGVFNSTHIHADYKIHVNGIRVDRNTPDYTHEPATLEESLSTKHNQFVHTHDGPNDTDVMHIHATGVTLSMALRALGITQEGTCISVDGVRHCADTTRSVRYYVNDLQIADPGSRIINDLDRILVSFGTEAQARAQLPSVGMQACIASRNCP